MAGGGGAWKVAYADFVTAMMAFFMVMWLTSQSDDVKKAVEGYFRDPWARYSTNYNDVRNPTLEEPKSSVEASKKKNNGSNARLAPHEDPESPQNTRPKFVTVRSNERTTTGTVVQFDPNQSELTETARRLIKNIIPQLSGITYKIDIRGHVSLKEFAESENEAAGWRLAFARCSAVMDYLEKEGIASDRMRPSVAGPHEPISIGASDSDVRKNARVEIFLLPEKTEGFKGTSEERRKMRLPSDTGEVHDEHASDAKAGGGHGGGHGAPEKKASGGH